MTAIEELIDTTKQLPPTPDFDAFEQPVFGPFFLLQNCQHDRSTLGVLAKLYSDPDLGIIKGYICKGSIISEHKHTDSREWKCVYKGKLKLKFLDDDSEVILNENDTYYIAPSRPHRIEALEDTAFWAVTIPPAKGFTRE